MIRRIAFTAAAAVFGMLLVGQTTYALTKQTILCVRAKRAGLGQCVRDCRTDLQTSLPDCFGPGAACATACSTKLNTCVGPFTEDQDTCIGNCRTDLQAKLAQCRKDHAGDSAAIEQCSAAPRQANLQCRLDCRAAVALPIANCNATFNECLEACASCPPGDADCGK